jgi:IS30 family transposase
LGSLAANALSLWLTGVADFSSVQKAASKTAAAVNETMISLLKDLPSLSVAPDRGKEFARYREVSAALNGVPFYFPPPQSP